MAKSMRSKVKRRWRSLKRKVVETEKGSSRLELMSNRLSATMKGEEYREEVKKNAFLSPEDPEAEFPQHKPQKMIDLRSQNIPYSGLEFVGAKRPKKVTDNVELNEEYFKQIQEQQEIEMGSDNENNDEDNKKIPGFSFQAVNEMEEEKPILKAGKTITKKQQPKKKNKKSKKIVSF